MLVIGSKVLRIEAFCVLLFYTPGESANLFGMAIAFISGITYAAYIIALYRSAGTASAFLKKTRLSGFSPSA